MNPDSSFTPCTLTNVKQNHRYSMRGKKDVFSDKVFSFFNDKGKLIHNPSPRLSSYEIDAISVFQFPLCHRICSKF